MAENKSIFAPGSTGMTTGGLDGILGPEAQDFSNLPEHTENVEPSDQLAELDCAGKDKDEAVCQIAKAEQAKNSVPRTD